MDPDGNIYVTEGDVPTEDRERLKAALAEDEEGTTERMRQLMKALEEKESA